MNRPFVPFLVAAALFVLLTAALTWPLVLHPASLVPNDLGDPLLNTWLLSWNARTLPLTERWWNLPQFHPIPGVMAYSEHLLGLSLIATPVIAVTGNPLLAYNVAFFLSFPLCALAAYVLTYVIARRHDAALVAAIAFGFAPYRMSQLAHVQVLSAYWMPVALAGLHLYFQDRRARWVVLAAAGWLLQALACGYYLIYLSVLMGLWMIWFAIGRERWRDVALVTGAHGLAAAALAPLLLGYWKWQHAYGLRRWPDEIASFSADILSVLKAPQNLRLWGSLDVVQRPESDLFPGFALVGLIAAGAIVAWGAAARRASGRVNQARALVGLAIFFGAVAATPLLWGPWKIEIAGIKLLSVSEAAKPFSVAVLLAIVAGFLHPAVRTAWRLRSPLCFYVLAALAMWVLALGPEPTFLNRPVLYKAPYAWLLEVPGVDGVRVPARFWMLAALCLAVAAGLALRHVATRWPSLGRALPLVMGAVLLVEAWPEPLRIYAAPELRPSQTRAVARLELPINTHHDPIVLYRAAAHERPVYNGYSGYFAPHYASLQYLLEEHDAGVLTRLSAFGAIEVVVDHEMDGGGGWRAFVRGHPQAAEVHATETHTIFRVERGPRYVPPPTPSGETLPIAGAVSVDNPHLLSALTDGDRVTRWHAGRPQYPGDRLVVDLGSTREVAGFEILLGGYVADFPRLLQVETSIDGQQWSEAWAGGTGLMAFSAAIDDPLDITLPFAFDPRPARFIRMTQQARERTYYWSIAELRVKGR